jgi:hypothetical protein
MSMILSDASVLGVEIVWVISLVVVVDFLPSGATVSLTEK